MLLEEPALVLHCFKLCFSRRFESSLLVVQIHLSLLPLDAFVEPSGMSTLVRLLSTVVSYVKVLAFEVGYVVRMRTS